MTVTMIDDAFDEVLAAARSGDELAFARLWRDLNPALLRYLRVLAPSSAADLASESWLQVMRSLSGFSGPELAFRGWVFTIARNKVTDAQRREGRRPRTTTDDLADQLAAPDDTARQAIDNLSTDTALALIATLPRDQAEVIVLRVIAGLDAATVGTMLVKSPGAVRVGGHRGLRRLQELVGRPPVTL